MIKSTNTTLAATKVVAGRKSPTQQRIRSTQYSIGSNVFIVLELVRLIIVCYFYAARISLFCATLFRNSASISFSERLLAHSGRSSKCGSS